ncbi:hypothetical protein OIU79_025378 [Salix purpurea]|uniref:Uncharacterized protein n=1 Tax=Salix purpurea TaxID=77065 RepID=A0A9Q0W5S7_SALPP|nr:hypothetical protein OIU79_025378 [Salix purpurea]
MAIPLHHSSFPSSPSPANHRFLSLSGD